MPDVVRDPYGNPLRQDNKIAALRQARIDALEEAAKKAEKMYRVGQIGSDVAAAIRALKEKA